MMTPQHVTKRMAAITPPRALVVLRFLLNTTEETDCFWPNPITLCYLNNYIRSAETGEIFGLIAAAKDEAATRRTSVSKLVSDFFRALSAERLRGTAGVLPPMGARRLDQSRPLFRRR